MSYPHLSEAIKQELSPQEFKLPDKLIAKIAPKIYNELEQYYNSDDEMQYVIEAFAQGRGDTLSDSTTYTDYIWTLNSVISLNSIWPKYCKDEELHTKVPLKTTQAIIEAFLLDYNAEH